jgi:hypothetical protein
LTVGGSSRLIIDLDGLTGTGRADGVVIYGSRNGTVPVFNRVEVVNNPHSFGVMLEYTDTALNLIVHDAPGVAAFTSTASSFTVQLDRPIDLTTLNLYGEASSGPADVTLTGSTVGPVRGSLVISPDHTHITFIKTGGPLAPDTYTAVLRGAANGLVSTSGFPLDGNRDGTPGGDHVTTFIVDPSPAVTVGVPDFR